MRLVLSFPNRNIMFSNKHHAHSLVRYMVWYSGKVWRLCGRGHVLDSPTCPNNFTWPLRGHVVASGLAMCHLLFGPPKSHRPITCQQISKFDWATCGNILGIFPRIFSLLTGLYGCLVIIPISLNPKFPCLKKKIVGSKFLIQTLFWVKRVALGSYSWDGSCCSNFDQF